MTPKSILYYPSIHFKDENWVKRALLYWDSVYRIVPVGGRLFDSDFIKELATIFSGFGASLFSGVAGIAVSGIQFLKNRLDYR